MNPYRHDENDVDYDDVAIFAIVRDPYERAISEYYYTNERNDIDENDNDRNNSRIHNATIMNRWLERCLAPTLENYTIDEPPPLIAPTRPGEKKSMPRSAVYYQRDGHFIPQYDYIFDGGGGGPQQQQEARRVVHHVLHFEHLQSDFKKLMAAYNLSRTVQLPNPDDDEKDNNAVVLVARRTRAKKLNKYNLTLDNIRRIETIYARDFATFGYPTISGEMEQ
jgi:Sulfotransferase family